VKTGEDVISIVESKMDFYEPGDSDAPFSGLRSPLRPKGRKRSRDPRISLGVGRRLMRLALGAPTARNVH
jgi:hypothetical protein